MKGEIIIRIMPGAERNEIGISLEKPTATIYAADEQQGKALIAEAKKMLQRIHDGE